jgi:hypothetical protein
MGMIDYSNWFQPIPQSPTSRGLGSLSTALDAIIARRQQQKQHEVEQQGLDARNVANNQRLMDEAKMRAATAEAEHKRKVAADQAVAAQHQAQQRLERDRMKMSGWKDSRESFAAGAPEVGQQQLVTAGLARPMDLEDIPLEDMLSYDVAPRKPTDGTVEDLDQWERGGGAAAQQGEDARTAELYGRLGKIGAVMPDGTARPVNNAPTPEELATVASQRFGHLAAGDPRLGQALLDYQAAQAAGGVKPEQAYQQTIGQARKDIEAENRARIAAEAAASRARMIKPPSDAQVASNARQDAAEIARVHGLKATLADIQQAKKLSGAATEIANGNWALTGQLAGMFSKASQGGTGVLTDKDLDIFWNKLGGLKERTVAGLYKWYTGEPTPEKLAKIKEALVFAEGAARAHIADIAKRMIPVMRRWGEDGDAWMLNMVGVGLPEFEQKRKEEALRAAAAKGGASGRR